MKNFYNNVNKCERISLLSLSLSLLPVNINDYNLVSFLHCTEKALNKIIPLVRSHLSIYIIQYDSFTIFNAMQFLISLRLEVQELFLDPEV